MHPDGSSDFGTGDRRVRWLSVDRGVGLACFAVLLVAWFPRLSPNFVASDDLVRLHEHALGPVLRLMVTQGRPGLALLFKGLLALGIDPTRSSSLLSWLTLGLLALTAVFLLDCWRLGPGFSGRLSRVVCASLPFVHPNLAELFSFRSAPFFFSAALALAFGGLAEARRRKFGWASGLLIVSFSIYQLGLNPLLVVIALGVAAESIDSGRVKDSVRGWIPSVVCLVVAAVSYLVLSRVVTYFAGLEPVSRSQFLGPAEVSSRLTLLVPVFRRVLSFDPALGTPALAWLQWLMVGATFVVAVQAARRNHRWCLIPWIVGLLALAVLGIVGLIAPLYDFWPAPRVLTAAGFFWAGAYALALRISPPPVRRVVTAGAMALILGYAGVDHRVASDQLRINVHDLEIANRIVGRLESMPGYRSIERVVIVNPPWGYPGVPNVFNLGISSLAVSWSQAATLSEVASREFAEPDGRDLETGRRYCANRPKWPADGSVQIEGSLAVVCF
jgi:hypothetical protein